MTASRIETLAEGVVLSLGDCRTILPTLGKVDAIVTDPPYGIGESNKKNLSRTRAIDVATPKDYGSFEWDQAPAPEWLIGLIRDISQWQIIFGGNYYSLP